jgi:outer membrane protein TolC
MNFFSEQLRDRLMTIGGWVRLPLAWMVVLASILTVPVSGQQASPDSVLSDATLERVVNYALKHQPLIQQAELDEEITNRVIRGKLADWLPQINVNLNYQRFIDLQTAVFNGNTIPIGVDNTSYAQFTASQTIFNRDVLLALRSASTVRELATQNTSRTTIDVVVNVTKAFYDVLSTAQQIRVNEESIARLRRSQQDALARYETGVSDKTDYKRATILLGNAESSLTSTVELLKYKEASLKSLMGYPETHELSLRYDTLQMETEAELDTTAAINYSNHIEYRLLTTQKELQDANVQYSNWAFIPSLNAFGAYNINYQSNAFRELYDNRFPYSYVGATLSFPIFQGGKRIAKIQEQKLASDRIDISLIGMRSYLYAEYTRALAAYKSNLKNYLTQKDNVALATEVFDIIELQYRNGVRPYLDVTVAESDLRTTRINYFNSLNQVLASKMDVLRALGQIGY